MSAETHRLFDPQAERHLVGWMLARPNHWGHVTETVALEDFGDPAPATAFAALVVAGVQSVQALAAKHPEYLDVEGLRKWAIEARDHQDERSIRSTATLVASLSMRRRIFSDARTTVEDALNLDLDDVTLIASVRERADRAEAPDSPPPDPAETIDAFMAGDDDPYDWVIDEFIERRDRMLVTATAGVGKSTLLRQIAVATAAGVHPFSARRLKGGPKRVLLLDLENSKRQVRRKLRKILETLHPEPRNLHVVAKPQVMDVTTSAGWRWLAGQCQIAKPDLIVGGPIYRLYEGGDTSKDMGGRDRARLTVSALDRLRDRYNCALVMEAHPPKGSTSLSPHGSAVWEWWPEFGVGLKPVSDLDPTTVDFAHWRFPRDERGFPKQLQRGGTWGWSEL